MKKFVASILKNRTAILFIIFVITIISAYSLQSMKQSVFPKVTFPQIRVKVYGIFSPLKDMELQVTKPLEDALHSISGIKTITSKTYQGSSKLQLTFNWNTNLDQAYQSVLTKAGEIKSSFPTNAKVKITRMTTSAFSIAGFSLYSDKAPVLQLKKYVVNVIVPQLEKVPGVNNVEVIGGVNEEYKVILLPEKLVKYHLNPSNIANVIKKSNGINFLGTISQEYKMYLGIADYRLKNIGDIENIIVGIANNTPIYLKQIARVEKSSTTQYISTSTDGFPAVLFNVTKHLDANVVQVSKNITKVLAKIQKKLPADIHIGKWYDLSQFVQKSVNGVTFNLLSGMFIISFVIFIFLRNFKSSIPLIIFMPLTLIIALLVMKIFGMTLNIMTLGGLSAAVGILVDNASVVVENITRYLQKEGDNQQAIIDATSEIITPLIFSTLTTIAVFIPMIMLSGVSGFFFKATSATIAISLSLSLFLAIFLIPIISFYFFGNTHQVVSKEERLGFTQKGYKYLLDKILKIPRIILILSLFLAIYSVDIFTKLPTSFLPVWDEGTFTMDLDTKPGTSLKEMSRIINGVEKVIQSLPEIKTYSRQTGDGGVRTNEAHFFMHPLSSKGSMSVFGVMDKLESKLLKTYPELNIDLHQILPDRFVDLSGQQDAVILKLTGNNKQELLFSYEKIKENLKKLSFIKKIKGKIPDNSPIFDIKFDKTRLARANLTQSYVSDQLKTALDGIVATQINKGVKSIDVKLTYPKSYKKYIEDLSTLPIFTPDGKHLPLSAIATIKIKNSPRIAYHENGIPIINVKIQTASGNLGKNVKLIEKEVGKLSLPNSVHVEVGGDWRVQQESFKQLVFIIIVSALLVFSLLLIQFKHYKVTIVLFLSSIFSLSFVILGLYFTKTDFNVSTFIGLIISLGIVVNNGILVVDFIQRYKQKAMDLKQSIVQAGITRIRPILITSITTIGGFLPMALRLRNGGEMLQPFAVAVIFGLIGSLIVSLIVVPSAYLVFVREK